MNDPYLISLLCFSATFIALEIALYFFRAHKVKRVRQILQRAKEEIGEVSQLPLNTPYPMIKISENLGVLYANPAAIKEFPDLKNRASPHDILRGIEKFSHGADVTTREIDYQGRIFHQTITASQNLKGKGYLIYCYDITRRIEAERELKKSYKETELARIEAEHANKARGDFLANMSHELRTPMNGIIGLSDILAEAEISEEHHKLAEAISNSSQNLLTLLNDILDFSKIEAGELTIENLPMDLRHLAAQTLRLHAPVAASKNLTLKTDIADDVPHYVMGDPSRLQQILNNLLSNALKFTHAGAVTLRIHGTRGKDGQFKTHISVQDTGIGIPKDKQAKVFAKFQQADTSTARKFGGTGLGLAITKDLAKLMGGTISIESEEGKGSTFTMTLPLTITDQKPEKQAARKDLEHEQRIERLNKEPHILVVDDHPVNLLYLTTALKKFGFTHFDEAASGIQAIKLCRNQHYDIILMDCQMPDMDGFEAASNIRTIDHGKKTTIIAVTADAIQGAKERCLKAGMDGYISKPVHKKDLLALLEKHLPAASNITPIATVTKPQAESDIFDRAILNDFTDGDAEMEAHVLDIFRTNLKDDISSIHKAYLTNNFEEWDRWAHKLYGACAHMGANALADICDQAQFVTSSDTTRMKSLHHDILEEYKKLHEFLDNAQDTAAAARA